MADENKELRRRIQELKRRGTEPGPFVASKYPGHFHRPTCKWANEISPENLIDFETHEEAVEAGYKPCKTCRS
jgi:micrococcal nuclease